MAETLSRVNLLPVARELRRRGHQVFLLASGAMTSQMHAENERLGRDAEPFLADFTANTILGLMPAPDLLVTGIGSGPDVGRDLTRILSGTRPTVVIRAGYGGSTPEWDGDPKIRPSHVLVNDQEARRIVLESWPEMHREDVVVIGNPSYDDLARTDALVARAFMRRSLGLDDSLPTVLYAGSCASAAGHSIISEGEALRMVVRAVNALREDGVRFHFIVRHHPGLGREAGEVEKTDWAAALGELSQSPVDSSALKTPEVLVGADVVIAMPGGIVAEAAVLHKQVIALSTCAVMERYALEWGIPKFPTAELGCCATAQNQEEVGATIKLGLDRGLRLLGAQTRCFKTDGGNTARVTNFLESLL